MDSARVMPVSDESATRKAELIRDALATLRAAHDLDERDELADLDATSFVAWYDRILPGVRDIKILAGAMEIELAHRRGERVKQENERESVTQRVTALPGATRVQRHRDRVIAAKPDAVIAYVQREAIAGKVPTLRGAVRAAKAARAVESPVTPSPVAKKTSPLSFAERVRAEVHARIELVQGQSLTEAELAERWGRIHPTLVRRYIRDAALYGDVRKEGNRNTITLTPALVAIGAHLRSLREEIARRRKENHDEFRQRRWNSELILKREQTDLLNWIEEQLDRISTL